jgi:hypothetical protein
VKGAGAVLPRQDLLTAGLANQVNTVIKQL